MNQNERKNPSVEVSLPSGRDYTEVRRRPYESPIKTGLGTFL